MIKIIAISVPEMSQEKAEEVHAGILSLMHSVGIDDFCVEISEEDEEKLIAELEQEKAPVKSWAEAAGDTFDKVVAKDKEKHHEQI